VIIYLDDCCITIVIAVMYLFRFVAVTVTRSYSVISVQDITVKCVVSIQAVCSCLGL